MPMVHIARKQRTSRTTVYRWIWRYELEGKEGLLSTSNRPKSPHPNTLSISKVRLIKRIRKRTKYGPRRIKLLLLKRNLTVSEYAIYRTLQRHNLIKKHKKTASVNISVYISKSQDLMYRQMLSIQIPCLVIPIDTTNTQPQIQQQGYVYKSI